jgi:hypothetical protein
VGRQVGVSSTPDAARSSGFAGLWLGFLCCLAFSTVGCGGKPPTRTESLERYSLELREVVAAHVSDEQRRNQMLVIVDHVEALNRRFNQETADFIDSYRKLNANYDLARPAFDELFADYGAKRVRARSEALDYHFQLASLATEAEWKSIGSAESELYEEVNASPATEGAK